jgi:hypothetical protein
MINCLVSIMFIRIESFTQPIAYHKGQLRLQPLETPLAQKPQQHRTFNILMSDQVQCIAIGLWSARKRKVNSSQQ